ncbi:hypothetical protein F5Y04DRAFT_284277 [Hypomontagnella monticulosa]|nr:hypothetical protein F5Y04DRAFT_284277 [Hypomontagnella monticulosa]
MRILNWILLLFIAVLGSATELKDELVTRNDTYIIGPIPVTDVLCTENDLVEDDIMEARWTLFNWGKSHRVPPKTVKVQVIRHAMWYQCNCKLWFSDPISSDELRHAQDLIFSKCGQFRSGHVWSKRWEKMYALLPLKAIVHMQKPSDLCPKGCAYSITM